MDSDQPLVVICFQISIFEPLNTAHYAKEDVEEPVVICFQISIFEPLNTAPLRTKSIRSGCDLLSN